MIQIASMWSDHNMCQTIWAWVGQHIRPNNVNMVQMQTLGPTITCAQKFEHSLNAFTEIARIGPNNPNNVNMVQQQ